MRRIAIAACVLFSGTLLVSCPGKQAEVHILTNGEGGELPVVVVSGSPFEMGYQYGQALQEDIEGCLDSYYDYALEVLNGFLQDEFDTDFEANRFLLNILLDTVWASMKPYVDERVVDEMRGIGRGAGVGYDTLRRLHAMSALMPFSCSSICAWHDAAKEGHLYQTRSLDFTTDAGLQEHACIVVYKPDEGHAHANFGFAGLAGAHTGLTDQGLVFAEIGDSSSRELPYDLRGEYFMFFFRRFMYDAEELSDIYASLQDVEHIKRYHYVFGDGVGAAVGNPYDGEAGGMKVRAHAPDDDFQFWYDNDPSDEVSPDNDANGDGYIAPGLVYHDGGRGRPTTRALMRDNYGSIDEEIMYQIATSARPYNSGLFMGIFDGTDLEGWLRFATTDKQAFETAPFYFDLKDYLD